MESVSKMCKLKLIGRELNPYKAGCGKTIIWYASHILRIADLTFFFSSTVIEEIMKSESGSVLTYFYFDTNDQEKQSVESLINFLVLSFTAKSNKFDLVDSLYEKHMKLTKPANHELLDVLYKLIEACGTAYIVVDALDECAHYDDLHDVIEEILHWQLPHCHLLVSSRREQYILEKLSQEYPVEIILSAELVDADIVRYIHETVEVESWSRKWGIPLQQKVVQTLVGGANGM
jgi:hypothetical protein